MTEACLSIVDETPARTGQLVLSMARRVRSELTGQVPGVPDLSRHDPRQPLSVLVYEAVPELARRLFRRDGIHLQMHADERCGGIDHITDIDLRWIIAEVLAPGTFQRAAIELRLHGETTGVRATQSLVADMFGRPIERGNPVEIASGKLLVGYPAGDVDRLTARISRFAIAAGWPISHSWHRGLLAAS